uniref:Uncharacterized protein n=1 Tax=Setaria italica TaxID=4555 RepID=K4AHV5_SETIT
MVLHVKWLLYSGKQRSGNICVCRLKLSYERSSARHLPSAPMPLDLSCLPSLFFATFLS